MGELTDYVSSSAYSNDSKSDRSALTSRPGKKRRGGAPSALGKSANISNASDMLRSNKNSRVVGS